MVLTLDFILNQLPLFSIIEIAVISYIIIFISAILESIPILGSFIPGQTFILISGVLAFFGYLNIFTLIVLASLGSILGDFISYYLGKTKGNTFLKKYGKYILLNKKRYSKLEQLLKNHLGKTLLLGRFNNLTRCFIPFIAGSIHSNYSKFFLYNILTGILWGSTTVLIGYFAGKSFQIISTYVGVGILVFSIAIIIGMFISNKLKKKGQQKSLSPAKS